MQKKIGKYEVPQLKDLKENMVRGATCDTNGSSASFCSAHGISTTTTCKDGTTATGCSNGSAV